MLNPTSLSSIEKSVLLSSNQRGGHGSSHGRSGGGRSSFRDGRGGFSGDEKDKFKCDHCGHFRHLNDTCWDLHSPP